MAKIKLTEHFSLSEFEASDTAKQYGITNQADQQSIANLMALCVAVLEPLRQWFGAPITIGSGYRCPRLNAIVGGVNNSQHLTGQAADLCTDGNISMGKVWFNYIKNHLTFDQLIWEKNTKTGSYWVHVSYNAQGRNRKQVIDNLIKA